MHFPFLLAVRLRMHLLVSNAPRFARRLFADEGWRQAPSIRNHLSDSSLLQHLRRPLYRFFFKVTWEQEIGVPVHPGLLFVQMVQILLGD